MMAVGQKITLIRLVNIVIPAAARKAFITGKETNSNKNPAIDKITDKNLIG
jgi:hypothetical protein